MSCKVQVFLKLILTDVLCVLLNDIRLQQVVGEDKGPLLHRVQQHGGSSQLITCAQLPPCCLGLRLQQIVHCLHHSLRDQKKDDPVKRGPVNGWICLHGDLEMNECVCE